MASTPPPRSLRAHTPPTPMHGPLHDNYEPYSPRRSKRSTAQSNPYASSHSDRPSKAHLQRAATPPTTGKRARFANTHLSSPPSSPASPHPQPVFHKTPRKTPASRALADVLSDSDNASRHHLPTPLSLLPTPSKTPKKRNAASMTSTARILNFQPYSPNDVMPSPRKMKKSSQSRGQSSRGFDLFEAGTNGSQEQIQIFTDTNARVPEHDASDDNPFFGPRQTRSSRPQRRVKSEDEKRMSERAARDEGVMYVFRGKKIFRRFQDDSDDEAQRTASPESDLGQRSLKRQAGNAAERSLTRSSIKPRLLFPSEEQIREREVDMAEDEVDEEALTDIEVPIPAKQKKAATPMKPSASRFAHLATPPSTKRTKRTLDFAPADVIPLQMVAEEPEETLASPVERQAGKAKNRSPFDDWPRSKSGSSRVSKKREASEAVESAESSNKRTRSGAIASPA